MHVKCLAYSRFSINVSFLSTSTFESKCCIEWKVLQWEECSFVVLRQKFQFCHSIILGDLNKLLNPSLSFFCKM